MAVSTKKGSIGIRDAPAGIEIRLRTTGTHRHSKTAIFPFRLNQSEACSISCCWMPIYLCVTAAEAPGRGGRGESVRACVNRLAGGDRAGMLRYQNKYRSVLKNRPEMLMEVANELRAEGLPCPDDVLACRRYNLAGRQQASLAALEKHMADPCVRRMVEGLTMLLERAAETPPQGENTVPYHKWAEARREADRLKVEVDLLKMALEDAQH